MTNVIIVEAARKVLGEIDLDPASSELAQETVQATVWYGPGSPHGEDGLEEPWLGSVFLNPPGCEIPEEYRGLGTQSYPVLWWNVLCEYRLRQEISAAIFIGFTLEFLRTAQGSKISPLTCVFCIPRSRMRFSIANHVIESGKRAGELYNPKARLGERVEGSSPAHGNVIVYLGPQKEKFRDVFSEFGEVVG